VNDERRWQVNVLLEQLFPNNGNAEGTWTH